MTTIGNDQRLRFIPACAGNRIPDAVRFRKYSVHPRVCGEQKLAEDAVALDNGSSPRVRGTVTVRSLDEDDPRFIPACAGNR